MKFETMDAEMEIRSSPGSSSNPNSYGYAENHHHQEQQQQQQQSQNQRRQHRRQKQQQGQSSSKWSPEENKMFENALAVYDKDSPDRWQNVAAMIPGRSAGDVMKQYEELEADVSSIEAGLVPVPGYTYPAFTLDWVTGNSNQSFDEFSHGYGNNGKRLASVRGSEQERKKGVPWTEEEHKLFLLGLKKYGKGDWRNISRNFVITRTPTQVASHAQKYFIRQLSGGKDKRRASIHDITTVNLNESLSHTVSPDHLVKRQHSSPDMAFQWSQLNNSNGGGSMDFNAGYGANSSRSGMDSYMGSQSMAAFQMQSAMHYPQV
ncbi:unnamed protein product [Rhodiola kirilowii]